MHRGACCITYHQHSSLLFCVFGHHSSRQSEQACAAVAQFLNDQIHTIKQCFNGKVADACWCNAGGRSSPQSSRVPQNLTNVMHALGVRIHKAIFDSVKQHAYNAMGASTEPEPTPRAFFLLEGLPWGPQAGCSSLATSTSMRISSTSLRSVIPSAGQPPLLPS